VITPSVPTQETGSGRLWVTYLNRYQWYVFCLAALGWLFDTFDQHIFTGSRSIAIQNLIPGADANTLGRYGGYATALFILGWATGGLIFGTVGDRIGRAKTMGLTVLLYAVFTGLSGLAQNWWQFGLSRLITGLGIGGEFAAGAALVAEVMPPNVRAKALGMLQALSAVGNIAAGFSLRLIPYMPHLGWRGLYLLGAAPALIAVIVQLGLREPDRWVQAKEAAREAGNNAAQGFGRYSDLFTNPRWRHNALVGLGLAVSGVIGAWGLAFYSPELIDHALSTLSAADVNRYKSWAFVLQHSGAFAGILGFSYVGVWFGRRLAFLLAFIVAWISVLVVFTGFHRPDQIWYMFPLLGFGTLAPFGLYAVYFPEIFPTKLRTTGTGFCYNVGRYLSVAGVLLMPSLAPALHGFLGLPGFRAAAVVVSCCYLIGIVSVLWAPETKGRPLPEDEVSATELGDVATAIGR
jgi:MFS family permease